MKKTVQQSRIWLRQTTKLKLIALLAVVIFASVALAVRAQNQQVLPLTVIPPKQEVLINPGERFSTSVKFLNQGDSPVTGALSVLDFIVEDDKGTPVFLDNPKVVGTTEIPAKYSAAKWITVPQNSLTIEGKGNVSVPITISVPASAAPGGRYAAVLFQPAGSLTLGNPESAQETPIAIRLASLIYIRVAGAISESASVTKFEGPTFLEYGPTTITTQILNQGNYHISPQGAVSLKNIFGQVVAKSNLDAKNIFPGTSRIYTNELGQKLMIGRFTASLNATYGDAGRLLTSTFVMWVFPWKIILAILLAFIIIALSGTVWYKKIKKKEEKLVEELKEEKTELEELKEELKDKITGENTPKNEPPPGKETK
jgi:hypothetical protein